MNQKGVIVHVVIEECPASATTGESFVSTPDVPNVPRGLVVRADTEGGAAQATLGALASEPRLRILELLSEQLLNMK